MPNKQQLSNLLEIELILHGAHHVFVVRTREMCFVLAICVHTVIFCPLVVKNSAKTRAL
jgi:hypothetical protein